MVWLNDWQWGSGERRTSRLWLSQSRISIRSFLAAANANSRRPGTKGRPVLRSTGVSDEGCNPMRGSGYSSAGRNRVPAETNGGDWRPPDIVAHHEAVRSLWPERLSFVPGIQGLHNQGFLLELRSSNERLYGPVGCDARGQIS